MRHGEAQTPISHTQQSDSQRKLTKQGEFEAQLMSNWFEKNQLNIGQLWVSPFVRAQQTCALVSKSMHVEAQTLDFITPSGDPKKVHDYIDGVLTAASEQKDGDNKALFIVSHMPLVSYLVAELTQYQAAPIFATAAIAEIDYNVETMQGSLTRLVSPLDLC